MSESVKQPNSSESIEPVKSKCLLIDDNSSIVRSLNRFFDNFNNFIAVECHSAEDALNVVKANSPKILFLDHSLTSGGAEGLEIVDQVKKINPEIEIYSTTTNDGVLRLYGQRGIKHIDKGDTDGLEAVISGK